MIEHVVLLSLICFGVHCITREGNALGYWEKLTADDDGNQICEMFNPLTECVICMPSFWVSCISQCLALSLWRTTWLL